MFKKSCHYYFIFKKRARVGKNRVTNIIKLGLLLFFCKVDLILAVPIWIAVLNIKKSTIYINLRIDVMDN